MSRELNLDGNSDEEMSATDKLLTQAAREIVYPVTDKHSPNRITGIAIGDSEHALVIRDAGLAARVTGELARLTSLFTDSSLQELFDRFELDALVRGNEQDIQKVRNARASFRDVGGVAPDLLNNPTPDESAE